jgi:hypothetical protein
MLYGGAAFGGKSHLMRVAAINWCTEISRAERLHLPAGRGRPDQEPHGGPARLPRAARAVGRGGLVKITRDRDPLPVQRLAHLPRHCKDEKHRFKYHGAEIHVLIVDELTTFTEVIYRYLRFRTAWWA